VYDDVADDYCSRQMLYKNSVTAITRQSVIKFLFLFYQGFHLNNLRSRIKLSAIIASVLILLSYRFVVSACSERDDSSEGSAMCGGTVDDILSTSVNAQPYCKRLVECIISLVVPLVLTSYMYNSLVFLIEITALIISWYSWIELGCCYNLDISYPRRARGMLVLVNK